MNTQVNGPLIVCDKKYETGREEIRVYLESVFEIPDVDETLLDLAVQAFTTPGYAKENLGLKDYERLEFLGDAIIKAYVSETIYKRYANMNEGQMSKLCHYLWNNKSYPFCVMKYWTDFHSLLFIPKSVKNQSIDRKVDFIASVVSDCFEAVIGALYLSAPSEVYKDIIDRVLFKGVDFLALRILKKHIEDCDVYLNKLANWRAVIYKG